MSEEIIQNDHVPITVDESEIIEEYVLDTNDSSTSTTARDGDAATPSNADEDATNAGGSAVTVEHIDTNDEEIVEQEGNTILDDAYLVFREHTDSLYSLACNQQFEDVIMTGGGDELAYLWSADDGLVAHRLEGHKESIVCCGFNFDGSLAASGALDGSVRVWKVDSGALEHNLEGPGDAVQWLSWHPRGNVLACGSDDGTVWMWATVNGKCMHVFAGHAGAVTCGSFTPDGKQLLSGGEDATIRVWNPKSGSSIHVLSGQNFHGDALTTLAFNNDAKSSVVISAAQDGLVCTSDYSTGKVLTMLQGHSESVECVNVSLTTPVRLATGSVDNTARIWDLKSNGALFTLEHEAAVTAVEWLLDTFFLYTSCVDGGVRLWETRTGDCLRLLSGHTDAVLGVKICKGGEFLVSISDDHCARVFAVDTTATNTEEEVTVSNVSTTSSTVTKTTNTQ